MYILGLITGYRQGDDTLVSALSPEDQLLYNKIVVQVKHWLQSSEKPIQCFIFIRQSKSWSLIQERLKKIKKNSADDHDKIKWVKEWEDRISRLEKLRGTINVMRNSIHQSKMMKQAVPEFGGYEDSEGDLNKSEDLVCDFVRQINEELDKIAECVTKEQKSITDEDRLDVIEIIIRDWRKLTVFSKCPEVSMFKSRLVADMRYPREDVKIKSYHKFLDASVRAVFVLKRLPVDFKVLVIEQHIASSLFSPSPSPSPSSRLTPVQDLCNDGVYSELAELFSSFRKSELYTPEKLKNVVHLALKKIECDGDSLAKLPAGFRMLYSILSAGLEIFGWTDRLTGEESESYSPVSV